MKKLSILIFGFLGGAVIVFLLMQNQINTDKTLIGNLQKTVDVLTEANKINQQAVQLFTNKIEPQPTPSPTKPSSNLKEVKTMNCEPTNGNGSSTCTEYDYWYDPNAKTKPSGTLPPNMLQTPLQALPFH